jgi:hypothetical protein
MLAHSLRLPAPRRNAFPPDRPQPMLDHRDEHDADQGRMN